MSDGGGAREKGGRIYAYVRFGKGERLEFRVPSAKSEDEGRERAAIMADVAASLVASGRRDLVRPTVRQIAEATTPKRLELVRKAAAAIVDGAIKAGHAKDITVQQWGERYTSGELSRLWPDHVKAKDWSDDISRLKAYVYPHVGSVPVVAFQFEHAAKVLAALPPEKVRREATRRHVAQIMGRLMHIAVFPGRLIVATPLPRGWLPKIEDQRHYSCLFPREEAMHLAHEATPIVFRLFCGVLNREGMRLSEAFDSTWAAWNLKEGAFTATDTKTGDPRFWACRPDTIVAMRIWREMNPGPITGRPFAGVDELVSDRTKIAEYFRRTLAAAGIDRPELFATTEHTGQLRAHDMRATFVTVSIAEGRSSEWIRDRTAHKSTSMIDRYRRTARQFAELKLGSLVHLAEGLGWWKAGGSEVPRGGAMQTVSAEKYRRRDSNPHALRAADFESDGGSRDAADQLKTPVETDVTQRSDTGFHHLSTTPNATNREASGGTSDRGLDGSTRERPGPVKARTVEVDGEDVYTDEELADIVAVFPFAGGRR